MKMEKIKPIPKYIVKLIKKRDMKRYPEPKGITRFYSYLTKNDGELVKVTVAVKNRYKNWHYKQVAVHGIHSDICFVKDMAFYYIAGYSVGWHDEGLTKNAKWYEDPDWGWHYDDKFDPFAPVVNPEYALKIPAYKYSACDIYDGDNIIKYLRMYEKYPQLEYVTKMGLSKFALSKQILVKLGKDLKFRKWLSKNAKDIASKDVYVSTIFHAYRTGKPVLVADAYERAKKGLCADKDYKPIRDLFAPHYEEFFSYIGEQKISNRLYNDYLKACNYLGLDMSDKKNRFPHDFKRWHDIRIDEADSKRIEKDKKERAEFYEKFGAVAEKYLPMQKDKNAAYLVIIAKSPAELKAEGRALHHCVGSMGYEQKFAREETLIFFIRSADAPDVPLVTMEYSLKYKKILQCYANGNTKPADDITTYINTKWLPYAKRQLKKIDA